jgi:hypothetical protein
MAAERPEQWSHKKLNSVRKWLSKHYGGKGYAGDYGAVRDGVSHAVRPEAI